MNEKFVWGDDGGHQWEIKKEARNFSYVETEKAFVIGEWEADKDGKSPKDIEGRVIHFNKDFHSIYIGYMHDG